MILTTTYITFKKRLWLSIRSVFIIFSIISFFSFFFSKISSIYPMVVLCVITYRMYRLNHYYINSFSIDDINKTLEIEVYKYDKFLYIKKMPLSECDLKLKEYPNKFKVIYQLQLFYPKKKLLIEQATVGNWKAKQFVEFYLDYKNLKNEQVLNKNKYREIAKSDE